MKDGWHMIAGCNVYVEGDKITHGTLGEGTSNYRTAWPYRWDSKYNAWNNCAGLTVAAFRAGVKRGTIKMKQPIRLNTEKPLQVDSLQGLILWR